MARPKGVRPHSPAPGQRQRKETLVHSITAKTPARTAPRAGDLRIAPSAPCRAPVPFPFDFFSLPPFTAHSLFFFAKKKGGPAKSRILWGEEEGTEQNEVLAARRGRSGRSFFRRHGGCKAPAIFIAESPLSRNRLNIRRGRAGHPALPHFGFIWRFTIPAGNPALPSSIYTIPARRMPAFLPCRSSCREAVSGRGRTYPAGPGGSLFHQR